MQIAAQTLIQEREYGLAVSYCTSAEDWPGLGRVVDLVLEEYIVQGACPSVPRCCVKCLDDQSSAGPAKFASLVAHIAPSLHKFGMNASTKLRAPAVFSHRLQFAVRFAEFHQRRANGDGQGAALDVVAMFRDEIAPRSWWAVILCDAVELLQRSKLVLPPAQYGWLSLTRSIGARPSRRRDALHVTRCVPADTEVGRNTHSCGARRRRKLLDHPLQSGQRKREACSAAAAGRAACPCTILRSMWCYRGWRSAEWLVSLKCSSSICVSDTLLVTSTACLGSSSSTLTQSQLRKTFWDEPVVAKCMLSTTERCGNN